MMKMMMVLAEVEDPPNPPMLMVELEEENRQELAVELPLVVPEIGTNSARSFRRRKRYDWRMIPCRRNDELADFASRCRSLLFKALRGKNLES
jgi:hypothetical protein